MCSARDFSRTAHSSENNFKRCCGGDRRGGSRLMKSIGKLHVFSVGPGLAELIPPLAENALRASDVIVGYELYLTWIKPWIDGKAVFSFALTQERARASLA